MNRFTPCFAAAALSLTFTACNSKSWRAPRVVSIGHDIALELEFDEPVVIAIESRLTNSDSWQPFGCVTLLQGSQEVTLARPEGGEDVRITLGVNGKIVDRTDSSLIADCSSTHRTGRENRALAVRDASITTQLQVGRGTIAMIGIEGQTMTTATRAFRR